MAMAKTLREKYQAGLEARGEKKVGETFKYLKYSRAKGGFYYLGRAGSLRAGKTTRGSVPCSESFKALLCGESVPIETIVKD